MLAEMFHSFCVHFIEYFCTKEGCHSACAKSSVVENVHKFHNEFPNITYQDETLHERLRDILSSTKTRTSNEQGTGKVVPQCDEILHRLRSTNMHATRNAQKHRQFVLQGSTSIVWS